MPESTLDNQEIQANGKINYKRLAGIILIVVGLAVLGYYGVHKGLVYYHQYLLKQAYQETMQDLGTPADDFSHVVINDWHPMRIVIPKINVDLMVQFGDVYDMELQNKGPVHFYNVRNPASGNLILEGNLPSTEKGNVGIAGHRGSRWGFFTDLDFLEEGDEIYLDTAGYRFIYFVEWIKIVEDTDWSPLHTTEYPAITLQTCEPKNAPATHRMMVRGALEKVVKAPRP